MSEYQGKPAWGGWNTQHAAAPILLENVMSEELAEQLQKEESGELLNRAAKNEPEFEIPPELLEELSAEGAAAAPDSTADDLLMAQMLQMEFDKEADELLKREQKHYNKNSKISISFEKYRQVHPSQQEEVYSDEECEAFEHKISSHKHEFNRKGIKGSGKNIVTKHDLDISSRKNASTAMDKFSLDLDTGDTDRYYTKLPNKVFNKLKVYSNSESKRAARLHEKKDQSTATQAVDRKTRLLLFKMLNSEMLEEVNGVISIGKESAVLHAVGGEMVTAKSGKVPLPDECALKVFKTTLAEFKNREMYVKGDFRLANEFKKQNPRKIMKMWAEKEMLNLKRMRKFGIPCPEVFKLKGHILVMQFIGKNQVPAPKLKDAKLNPEQLCSAYQQVVQGMKTLYKRCTLVHADLSEYNMLWSDGQVIFIDVSQSVDLSHPRTHDFLLRDCRNVVQFFTKHNTPMQIPTEYELFNDITDMGIPTAGITENEFLQHIQEYEKELAAYELDSQRKEFAFDLMFNKHCKDLVSDDSDVSDEEGEELEEGGEEEQEVNNGTGLELKTDAIELNQTDQ